MKTRRHAMILGAALVTAGWLAAGRSGLRAGTLEPQAEPLVPPERNQKTVVLDCSHGWRSSAQGQYGGVGFTLFCQNGRDRQKLVDVTGTAYSVRIGAESESTALDCFFTGDAGGFNETCGGAVRITLK